MTSPTGEVLPDALIMFAVCYAATWALATLSYHVIEEPFLQMRRSYGSGAGKSKTLAAVADTAARG
jgi:peptidoglycan/LPS O-acetylase OafA/YrhL